MRRLGAMFLVAAVAGCAGGGRPASSGPAPSARAAPEGSAAAEVSAAMGHYVALTRRVDSDSVAAMYTADGELLEPRMAPLRGREAIRRFLAPFDARTVVDTAAFRTTSLDVYGDVAYQWGTYHQVARLDGGPPGTFDGRFAAQWRRDTDGRWRLARLLMQVAPAS
ncbi:MAG: DUF4440 domain-containing protein [Gemmatimonadetes bacterium]|nr:DUF4440 domain-containing protein [Gemmatimonadota bacterium]